METKKTKLGLKAVMAALLGAGVKEEDIKVNKKDEPKKLFNVFKFTPTKSTQPGWKGYPGDAKRNGRIKRLAKLHVIKMAKAAARKENRKRFKAIMLTRLNVKHKIKKASNKTIKVG